MPNQTHSITPNSIINIAFQTGPKVHDIDSKIITRDEVKTKWREFAHMVQEKNEK